MFDASTAARSFQRLCQIVAQLRAPGGCPWDRAQTNDSLLPALIEEAYEVASAVRAQDDANFREELGDLLLVIVMHAEIAREQHRFDINAIVDLVSEKLIRRHPHVFGTPAVAAGVPPAHKSSNAAETAATTMTPDAVVKQWEAIKRDEKQDRHYLGNLPTALPALMRAQKAQKKVARVNFDWTELRDVVAKVDEELGETKSALASQDRDKIADEIGDLLFAIVNLARKTGLDAESALQMATDKFVTRFNKLEDELRARGKKLGDVDLAELDAIWNRIKGRGD